MVSSTTHSPISDTTTSPIILSPEVLASFHCPISYDPMNDPVICADGQTYNRSSIETWFAAGNITSPLTGAPLPHLELIPNIVLRNIILSHFPSLSSSATSLSASSAPASAPSASSPSPPSSPISSYLQHPINDDNYSDNWLHPNNIPRRYIRRVGNLNNQVRRNQQRREVDHDDRMRERRARLNSPHLDNNNNNNNNPSDISNNILNHLTEIINLINNNHFDNNTSINSTNIILSHLNTIESGLVCDFNSNIINENFNNEMSRSRRSSRTVSISQ